MLVYIRRPKNFKGVSKYNGVAPGQMASVTNIKIPDQLVDWEATFAIPLNHLRNGLRHC